METGDPREKPQKKRRWRSPLLQPEQRYSRISSSSLLVNPSTSSLSFLIWLISLIMFTFQWSYNLIGWYLILIASLATRCSTLFLWVRSKIFLRLFPVVDLVSLLIRFNICFGSFFLESLICDKKFRNLFMRTILTCLAPVIGSMRLRWVLYGRLNIILTEVS